MDTLRQLGISVLAANILAALVASSALAISYSGIDTNGNYHEEKVNRFYSGTTPSPNYQFSDLDLSGVGFGEGAGNLGWVTMISDSYYLSAGHWHPTSSVTFKQGNGTPTASQSVSIDTSFNNGAGGVYLDGSDLWLGKLDGTAPSWAKIYPVISRQETMNYVSYLDKKITIVGFRGGDPAYAPYNVGLNNISTIRGSDKSYQWFYDDGAAYDVRAARLVGGDSSGPSFVQLSNGLYALAGIHWQGDANHDTPTAPSIDSSVSAHITAIKSYVSNVQVVNDFVGDVDGDWDVDFTDIVIMSPNYNKPYNPNLTYGEGDLNDDGFYNFTDVLAYSPNFNKKLTAPSDFNKDFKVDIDDAKVFADHWGGAVTPGTYADINSDGVVNATDLAVFDKNMRYPKASDYPTYPHVLQADPNHDGERTTEEVFYVQGLINSICAQPAGCPVAVASFSDETEHNLALLADVYPDGTINFADVSELSSLIADYIPGQMDRDSKVGPSDAALFFDHWHDSVTGGPADGDFDLSGFVDDADLALLVGVWGYGLPQADGHELVVVPEPSTVAMLALGALVALIRKNRVSR